MPINVSDIPGLDPNINAIRRRTADFVNDEILPNEERLWESLRGLELEESEREHRRRQSILLREEIKAKVNEAGLWAPHLPKEYGGMGLDFLSLAYMYEVLAYATGASTLFGVAAPNSGNATILVKYGTEEQKQKWLLPLVEGKMESGFSMTEPDSAGSDPRSIKTEAVRVDDDWVINGHKWFTSNGIAANFFIVMCRANDPTGELGKPGQMTQIIVPTDTAGREDRPWHRDLRALDLRPLRGSLRERPRAGGEHARPRRPGPSGGPGPPRRGACLPLHEFDRSDVAGLRPHGRAVAHPRGARRAAEGQGVRAGVHRRQPHGHPGVPAHDDQRRREGGEQRPRRRTAISAIKVFVPAAFHRVVDRAIQVWGGAGVTQ